MGRVEGADLYFYSISSFTETRFLDSTIVPRMISRNHAKIVQTSEIDDTGMNKWKIVDCNSVNGLFVNNVKVPEAFLK